MASKKYSINVKQKLKYKAPLKKCEPAIDDIVRIRNNEQQALRRLKSKFKATDKKGQADALRRQIKAHERAIDQLKGNVADVRSGCRQINALKAETKSLKLQNAAINRRLQKMYESRQYGPEYDKLNSKFIKNNTAITNKERAVADVLYRVNKNLGFEPEAVAKRLGLPKKWLEKHHADDFADDYFDEYTEVPDTGAGETDGEEIDELPPETGPDRYGYIQELEDVFWRVWADFDKNEKFELYKYKTVTFEFGGQRHKISGKDPAMVIMKAAQMWRWCATQPPYVYVIKYVALNDKNERTKLKYVAWQQ